MDAKGQKFLHTLDGATAAGAIDVGQATSPRQSQQRCRAKCTRRTPHAVTVAEVVPQDEEHGASSRNLPGQPSLMWRTREPYLCLGLVMPQQLDLGWVPRDEQVIEYVFFTFTDARGARWQRLGSEQPEPQVD